MEANQNSCHGKLGEGACQQVTGRDRTGRDGTGRDGTGRDNNDDDNDDDDDDASDNHSDTKPTIICRRAKCDLATGSSSLPPLQSHAPPQPAGGVSEPGL